MTFDFVHCSSREKGAALSGWVSLSLSPSLSLSLPLSPHKVIQYPLYSTLPGNQLSYKKQKGDKEDGEEEEEEEEEGELGVKGDYRGVGEGEKGEWEGKKGGGGAMEGEVMALPVEVIQRNRLSEEEIRLLPRFSDYSPGHPSNVQYLYTLLTVLYTCMYV